MGNSNSVRACDGITPQDGSLAPVFAAAHPLVSEHPELYAGAFLIPFRQIYEQNENMTSTELAENLWRISEEVVKPYRNT